MRILLVEDEQKTGDYLKQGLSEAGYITDWVTDGLTGKQYALSEDYDVIILDGLCCINLPLKAYSAI